MTDGKNQGSDGSARTTGVSPSSRPETVHGEPTLARGPQGQSACGGPDLSRVTGELTDALAREYADLVAVHVPDQILAGADLPVPRDAPLRRLAISDAEGRCATPGALQVDDMLQPPADSSVMDGLAAGETVHLPSMDADAVTDLSRVVSPPDTPVDLWPRFGGGTALVVPLTARSAVLGHVLLLRTGPHAGYTDEEMRHVEELTREAAVSVDNDRLYLREARAAETLQRSMLPDAPPVLPGVRVAQRYLRGTTVRADGDWFDTIPLPGRRVALAAGDVMGHGLESAAVMGQFRTALWTLANLDLPPDQILRQLDELAQQLGDLYLATCIYVVYDPAARTCQVANAGHLPPILVDPAGHGELLTLPPGVPVGVGHAHFETEVLDVPDGTTLVLCTDGPVEVQDESTGASDRSGTPAWLAELCAGLAIAGHTVEQACDEVVRVLGAENRVDDVALLMARFAGPESATT